MMDWNECRRKGNEIKVTEVGGVHDTNEQEEKCVQDFI